MSQYQPSVRYMPPVVPRPRLWMSVIKAISTATFIFLSMPNSLAVLMALMVSPPPLARPMTLAPELCAFIT